MRSLVSASLVILASAGAAHAQAVVYYNSPDINPTAMRGAKSMAMPARPQPAPANWSGFYTGIHFSGASSSQNWSDPSGNLLLLNTPRFPANASTNGGFNGLALGWNYQSGGFISGLEANAGAGYLSGNAICGGVYGAGGIGWNCRASNNFLADVALRGGFADENTVFYAKAGLALTRDRLMIETFNPAGFPNANPQIQGSSTRLGTVFGFGVSYALTSNWALNAEYDHYQFGKRSFSGYDSNFATSYGAKFGSSIELFKIGLNYHFNSGIIGAATNRALPIADASIEVGSRIGFASSRFQKLLYDNVSPGQLNSRLTWPGQHSIAQEAFGHIQMDSGLFARAMLGGALQLGSAKMNDEDFPPALTPYSNTTSATKSGRASYGTLDIGYRIYGNANANLRAFVGYNYYSQHNNAYGCTQVATGDVCLPVGIVENGQLGLAEHEEWNSMRLGLGGDFMLTDRLKLSGDAAWLALSSVSAADNHWLRPDINPMVENGSGSRGYQFEGILSYRLSERSSIGVGARHWAFSAPKGSTTFPGSPTVSPEKLTSSRTAAFVQFSYLLGGSTGSATPLIAKY